MHSAHLAAERRWGTERKRLWAARGPRLYPRNSVYVAYQGGWIRNYTNTRQTAPCPFVNGRALEDERASRILDHNGSTELWSPSLSPGGHGNCTSDHSPAFEEVRQKADFKLLQLECPWRWCSLLQRSINKILCSLLQRSIKPDTFRYAHLRIPYSWWTRHINVKHFYHSEVHCSNETIKVFFRFM